MNEERKLEKKQLIFRITSKTLQALKISPSRPEKLRSPDTFVLYAL